MLRLRIFVAQESEFLLSPEQRCRMCRLQRLEARSGRAATDDFPDMHGLIKPPDIVLAEVCSLEHPAEQSLGGGRDQDVVCARQGLQACRQVRSLADEGKFGRGTLTNEVTGDYDATRYPDPYLEPP